MPDDHGVTKKLIFPKIVAVVMGVDEPPHRLRRQSAVALDQSVSGREAPTRGERGRKLAPPSSNTWISSTTAKGSIRHWAFSAPLHSNGNTTNKSRQPNPGVYKLGASALRGVRAREA